MLPHAWWASLLTQEGPQRCPRTAEHPLETPSSGPHRLWGWGSPQVSHRLAAERSGTVPAPSLGLGTQHPEKNCSPRSNLVSPPRVSRAPPLRFDRAALCQSDHPVFIELNFSSTVDWPSTADKQVCTLVLSGQQATSSRQRGGDQGVHGSMKALNRDWLGQKGTQSCCRWIRDLCMELLGSGPRGGVQVGPGSRGCLLVPTTGTAAFVPSGGVLSSCFSSLGGSNLGGGQWRLVCGPAPGDDARCYPDRRVLRNQGDPEAPLCPSALLGSAGSEAPGPREGIEAPRPGLLPALHKVPETYHKMRVSTGWDRSSWIGEGVEKVLVLIAFTF